MELKCTWLLLVSLLSVYGYTPTFRNEATHPLKAPTESTLGLQINDESFGRTKSNTPKHEPYFFGGKHFEYMLFNDSNVLLTSLQNDGPFDLPSEPPSLSNEEHLIKTNSSSNNDENVLKNTKQNQTEPTMSVNYKGTNMNESIVAKKKTVSNMELKKNDIIWSNVNKEQSPVLPTQIQKFNFDKLVDISSTTKLYSKHGNKTKENFASFTSPLGKPLSNGYNYEEMLQDENQTNDYNVRKKNYDYDDSFTKLLISNGILKPDNITNKTSGEYVKFFKPIVNHGQNQNSDRNPSVEDINRIMDGSVANLIRNNTETKIAIQSHVYDLDRDEKVKTAVNASIEVAEEKTVTNKPKTTFELTTISLKSTNADTKFINSNIQLTNRFIVELNTKDFKNEMISKTSSVAENVTDKPVHSFPNIQKEILETPLYGLNSTQFGGTDINATHFIPTTQSSKINFSKLTKDYKISDAKPVSSFADFAHTNVSNENPLSIISNTDSSNIDLKEKNTNKVFSKTIISDDFTKFASTNKLSTTFIKPIFNKKMENNHLSRNFIPLTQFYSFGDFKSSSQEIRKDSSENNGSKKQGRSISITEFKSLIEKCVISLFYPVAQYINNYKEVILKRNSIIRIKNIKYSDSDKLNSKVILKRFGLADMTELLKKESRMNNYDYKSQSKNALQEDTNLDEGLKKNKSPNWTDLNNGTSINIDKEVNDLFVEDDDQIHWFVLLLAGNWTIVQLHKDFVKYLKVNLGAKLSLEYDNIKINAIIIMPLTVNVSLPTNESSSINVNEELDIEQVETNVTLLELLGQKYRVLQLLSLKYEQSSQSQYLERRRILDTKHDDIELCIFVFLGAICTFGILSPLLYGIYRLIQSHSNDLSFKMPKLFGDGFRYQNHEKMSESRCESLNVIFSEDFDTRHSSSSWFDNTQHSSCILKPSTEAPSTFFNDKIDDFPEFSDFSKNAIENSPRLNKENKLNMLSCRSSCVLLPHPATYLIRNENEERYFDNPNYNQDDR